MPRGVSARADLALVVVDEMFYNERGNEVLLIKRLS